MVPTRLTPIVVQFQEALDLLAATPVWLQMLSENVVYKGGIERFFHRSFLWAFHVVNSPRYWAEPERRVPPLTGNQGIDLLIYENTPENLHDAWSGTLVDEGWLRMGRAFVEMKDNWSRKDIPEDIRRLRLIDAAAKQAGNVAAELYEFFLLQNFFNGPSEEECVLRLLKDETAMRRIAHELGVPTDGYVLEKWLLQGETNPSDHLANTYFKVTVVRL